MLRSKIILESSLHKLSYFITRFKVEDRQIIRLSIEESIDVNLCIPMVKTVQQLNEYIRSIGIIALCVDQTWHKNIDMINTRELSTHTKFYSELIKSCSFEVLFKWF